MVMREAAEKIMRDLFDAYMKETASRPENMQRHVEHRNGRNTPRVIADFIASMTDSYAVNEHKRLFDDTPKLG